VGSLNDGATILTPSTGAAPDAAASAETLWLGTQAGVAVLAGTEQQRYGTDYGLAGEDVRAVLIDSQGRKWFGTEGGVTMYDGFGWTSYFPSFASISSNYVARVAVDPQGRTWFTYGDRGLGVSVQDGDEWQQYTEADGLGSDRVYSSAFGLHGETWLGTARGVSQWNSTRWTDLSTGIGAPNGAITALAVSPAGFLWAGFDGGVARYDGRRWTTYGASDGLDATAVTAIVFDDAGRVWAAAAHDPDSSRSGGLFVFEDGGWRPVPPNRASNGVSGPAAMPLGDNITDLAVDGAGRVWVGAHAYAMAKPGFVAGGVSVLPDTLAAAVTPDAAAAAAPGDATLWTIYTPAAGLLSDYVTALAVDAQDHVWIGTEQGLAQFDGKSWTSFTTANGLPHNHVTDLASTPEGGLWVTTDGGGAVYYDGQAWTNLLTVGIADRVVNALAEGQDGSIWAATAGGVSRYAGTAWTAYTMLDGLAINDSRAVTVDGEGAVWIGGGADRYTGAGLSRFDGEDWTTYPLQDNMPYPNVSALAVAPDGSAWAVGYTPQQFTHASALFTYDGAQWVRKGGPGPLNDDAVYAFTIGADGRMWFGTDGSYDDKTLVVWDGLTWSAYAIGDAAADVHAIAFADEGRGWLGTDLGLAALDATPADLRVTWVEGMRKIAVQAIGVEQTATE
jgi:ligand-binding sensor domain-containing protein